MRLYHPRFCFTLLLLALLAACTAPKVTQGLVTVYVTAEGKSYTVQLAPGSTARQAVEAAGVTVTDLDRSEPPFYTVMTEGATVRLIRVVEEFEVEQVIVPFEHRTIRNESLPEGETRLAQAGVNGLQENTYRRVLEDGVEVSRSVVKSVVVSEPVPEILMVGGQALFAPLLIPGRLAYLSAGNAWLMETSTGNRRPIVTTGDLDGRIFSLSPDGQWLLFSRTARQAGQINDLWAARLSGETVSLVDLRISNVVHFAAWAPNSINIAYSTVEPRRAAPGWQANNDLKIIGVSASGFVSSPNVELEVNAGGIYGWWGTSFAWSPDGKAIAYSRPDGIGLVDKRAHSLTPLFDIVPLQTGSDWAWSPGVAWGPDGKVLYSVAHVSAPQDSEPEKSPVFDLTAIPLEGGLPLRLAADVGMFAYPCPSPLEALPSGETAYRLAYLQAIQPAQSDVSRYRVAVMDRDGSNRQVLFPAQDAAGLEPQRVVWSPTAMGDPPAAYIAVVYQGNIWLINSVSGQAQQVTGDGLTSRLDWK